LGVGVCCIALIVHPSTGIVTSVLCPTDGTQRRGCLALAPGPIGALSSAGAWAPENTQAASPVSFRRLLVTQPGRQTYHLEVAQAAAVHAHQQLALAARHRHAQEKPGAGPPP